MKTTRLHPYLSAAVLGSLIAAGCTTAPSRHAETAIVDPAVISNAPIDQSKRRPDTHPEIRSGLWQFTYNNQHAVIEAPEVQLDSPFPTVDTTALLPYNPEVINVALASPESTVIVEAAGARRSMADDMEAYSRDLEERARQLESQADEIRRNQDLPTPPE